MEDSISIFDFINTLKKRWRIITIFMLIGTLSGVSISYFFITPIYHASTTILVNQRNTTNQVNQNIEFQNNADLINTYSMIIKSPAILDKVIEKLELENSTEQLIESISINSQENSQVFVLSVENANPKKAVEIANTITETFQEEIKEIMSIDNVNILAAAKYKDNPKPVRPNHLFTITISVVVGLMAGVVAALIRELMDKTIKNEDDVTVLLGLPVLGSIQKITGIKEYRREFAQDVRGHKVES